MKSYSDSATLKNRIYSVVNSVRSSVHNGSSSSFSQNGSSGGAPSSSSAAAPRPPLSADAQKQQQKGLQQRLLQLRHVSRCNVPSCPETYCAKFKAVLRHIRSCKDGQSCSYEHCASSQALLLHARGCKESGKARDCAICGPVIKYSAQQDQLAARAAQQVRVGEETRGRGEGAEEGEFLIRLAVPSLTPRRVFAPLLVWGNLSQRAQQAMHPQQQNLHPLEALKRKYDAERASLYQSSKQGLAQQEAQMHREVEHLEKDLMARQQEHQTFQVS